MGIVENKQREKTLGDILLEQSRRSAAINKQLKRIGNNKRINKMIEHSQMGTEPLKRPTTMADTDGRPFTDQDYSQFSSGAKQAFDFLYT